MGRFDYLIVGGGMTADAAARGIRKEDAKGTIGIVGAEAHPPYNRPPLTKGLWKGEPLDGIWRKTEEAAAEPILPTTDRRSPRGSGRASRSTASGERPRKLLPSRSSAAGP